MKYMSTTVKIGQWIVKWKLQVIIIRESWRWGVETSDQEYETKEKVRTKMSKVKLKISKCTQVWNLINLIF